MRTALTVLGAVVLVPLALGFVAGLAAGCSLAQLNRWLASKAAARLRFYLPKRKPAPPQLAISSEGFVRYYQVLCQLGASEQTRRIVREAALKHGVALPADPVGARFN